MKTPDYSDVWENFIKDNYFPTSLRNPRTLDFKEFKDMVYNKPEKTKQLNSLRKDMEIAAKALNFIEAARIRDIIKEFKK